MPQNTSKLGEKYTTNEAAREAASRYIGHGFAVVPIEDGKNPNRPGWEKLRITEEQVSEFFTGDQNIGLLLGEPSGGLVDVDLDVPEAVSIAGRFLRPTRTSGRRSAPDSHWWYIAPETETEKFQDLNGEILVELRSTGAQTLVAPSVHPGSGEVYEWRNSGLEIVTLKPEELLADCRKLATATLIARYLPKIRDDATGEGGGRHHYAMALAGFLLRPGRLGEEDALAILKAAWDAKDFPSEQTRKEAHRDLEGIVRDTAANLEAGRSVTGPPP
jgi:putative DNA primase/helicase